MKITKSQLKRIIKEELESVLQEMDTNPYRVQPGGREHEAEKASNVKFTRGPCINQTASQAMRNGCRPGPCDEFIDEDENNK